MQNQIDPSETNFPWFSKNELAPPAARAAQAARVRRTPFHGRFTVFHPFPPALVSGGRRRCPQTRPVWTRILQGSKVSHHSLGFEGFGSKAVFTERLCLLLERASGWEIFLFQHRPQHPPTASTTAEASAVASASVWRVLKVGGVRKPMGWMGGWMPASSEDPGRAWTPSTTCGILDPEHIFTANPYCTLWDEME